MSRIEVPMPQMGESIAEGTVAAWLKKVGDAVERDEPIMEISTDKVDAEIPAPSSGVLVEILVQEGNTVEVGTVVAYIESNGTAPAVEGVSDASVEGRDDSPARLPDDAAAEPGISAPEDAVGHSSGEAATSETRASPPEEATALRLENEEERLRRRSTPLVRRIAEEHGIALAEIPGTGRGGRVTKKDILRYVAERDARAAPPTERTSQGPTQMSPGPLSWDDYYTRVEHPRVSAGQNDRTEPMDRMTSLIAEHMILSKRTSAHVHSYIEVDYSMVDRHRERNGAAWDRASVRVTYTAYVARAVARALSEFPRLNAAVSGGDVIYRGKVNLGIAVALESGLIVPVIPDAGDLSIVGLARAISDLADRARSKKLAPEEVRGGTFTITNPGIFGTVLGFPILNQPQVGILGIGAIEKRAVVVADEFRNDAIVSRKRGYLSLGFDHRLVNGADADRFLGRVKELLQATQE